ncbi:MAG TPA: hypothetical protein VFA34_12315 [Actinomycetota bacterium]|jgi:hypothetical protein|nr:hypothetical protein [Actinomycetota bacterium]
MMRRFVPIALLLVAASCVDDQVVLRRGPLGPAAYEVEVSASGGGQGLEEHRLASLRITPRKDGSDFALRAEPEGRQITARIRRRRNGTIDLLGVRGAPVDRSRQAELASLVGQLAPPLPLSPVRIGEQWSSSQHIRTSTLRAVLRTELGISRFRRIASIDAAQLEGTVRGQLETNTPAGFLSGRLRGLTSIAWAVESGRVVSSETNLVWTLTGGDTVTLVTRVRPR